MKKILTFFLLLIAAAGAFALREKLDFRRGLKALDKPPQRIASLSPGITETLFAVGLGGKIVGATRFCVWPPEARAIPRIGGFMEINLEALARVRPELAILPDAMSHYSTMIESLGILVMTFDSQTLSGFLQDLEKLGALCGASKEASRLATAFKSALAQGERAEEIRKPAVLFSILNPEECARPIGEITILGKDGFYNEIIEAAGGVNAYQGEAPYPRISKEAILALNPDIIIAAAPGIADPKALRENWEKIGKLKAVERNSLKIMTDPGVTIPGPRALRLLEEIRAAVEESLRQELTLARPDGAAFLREGGLIHLRIDHIYAQGATNKPYFQKRNRGETDAK